MELPSISAAPLSAQPSPLAHGLRCPVCRAELRWEDDLGSCSCTGQRVPLRGGRVPDFLGSEDVEARRIWAWPAGFLRRARPALEALRDGAPLPSEALAELQTGGLVDTRARLTPLGRNIAYHLK